jgi:hypothetical protein
MDLLEQSEALFSQAETILRESNLPGIFSRLGEIYFAGSYQLRLMVRPDIDMIVTTETPSRDEAVRATKELLDCGYFQSVVFIDHYSWGGRLDAKMNAKGFYWHLDLPKFERQWKCDVWYLRPEENTFVSQTERFESLLEKEPGARETILQLKHAFRQGKGYRGGATGAKICSAVLEHGITEPDALVAYLRSLSENEGTEPTRPGTVPL